MLAAPAGAATIAAAPGNDGQTNDQVCSLREAIDASNGDSTGGGDCTAGSGTDTITLAPGDYNLAGGGAGEDANAGGDLDITASVTISGAGASASIIHGTLDDRVLDVLTGTTVSIAGVTITGGHAPAGAAGATGSRGGGIHNAGNLTLARVSLTANRGGRGGDGAAGAAGGMGGGGGGLWSRGGMALTVSDR